MYDGEERRANNWHLNKTFTIGNLLTIAVSFVTVIVYINKMDIRMALTEQTVHFQGKLIAENESRKEQQFTELKVMIQRIDDRLHSKK